MKTKHLIIGAVFIGSFGFTSCNKCKDCHYDHNGMEHEIGELCNDELKDAEANGYSVGDTVVTIHCEEH